MTRLCLILNIDSNNWFRLERFSFQYHLFQPNFFVILAKFSVSSLIFIFFNRLICHSIACVAGRVSHATAFGLVAKPWTLAAKPRWDWWGVQINFTRGFDACEFPRGPQVKQMAALPPNIARFRIPIAAQASHLIIHVTGCWSSEWCLQKNY